VTGATGKQGGALAQLLLERGHHVRALTRKPDGPAAIGLAKAGAEVVPGNFGDRVSVERAAKGMDVAFIVATPYEEGPEAETRLGTTAIDGAQAAGVPYIVYSSVSDGDRRTGIPHFDSKAKVEEHLKRLGVPYSIVAPVFFMENLLAPWIAGIYSRGILATGVLPDRKLQVITVPDIAEFTTLAIERPAAFQGKRINIASDELSPVEMARRISEVAGTKLTYQAIPIDQVRAQSEDTAKMYDWFNRVGYSADIAGLKKAYPEVRWRSFRDWSAAQDWSKVMTSNRA
jgi:uncharacterized protein YbjT (DUF2867 family)